MQVANELAKIVQSSSQDDNREVALDKLKGASQLLDKIVSLVFTLCSFVDY